MPKPTSPPRSRPQPSLRQDHDREGGQPYATEVEDYKHGVATPPVEQPGREANPRTTRARTKKNERRATAAANAHDEVARKAKAWPCRSGSQAASPPGRAAPHET